MLFFLRLLFFVVPSHVVATILVDYGVASTMNDLGKNTYVEMHAATIIGSGSSQAKTNMDGKMRKRIQMKKAREKKSKHMTKH